jgi:hypothetical protein
MLQADGNPQDHPAPCLYEMQLDSLRNDNSLNEAIETLNEWKKKYSKDYSNLRVVLAERGEQYFESVLVLYGSRLETKEEVKKRLKHWALRFLTDQLTHVRMIAAYKRHLRDTLSKARIHIDKAWLQRHDAELKKANDYLEGKGPG